MLALFLVLSLLADLKNNAGSSHPPVGATHPSAIDSSGVPRIDHEFSLKYRDLVSAYDSVPLFVLPNEKVEFEILFPYRGDSYVFYNGSEWIDVDTNNLEISWYAPNDPGMITLKIKSLLTDHLVSIHTFVKTPATNLNNGALDSYIIGNYPERTQKRYVRPDGYIKVTKENRNEPLSSNFTLGEFPSKQTQSYPKYSYLSEKLILKLEGLKRSLNQRGVNAKKVVVMSGYRTPHYNKKIGNVALSRHVFGDAADIFIDNDGDHRMDDLNADGKSDYKDAVFLSNKVEEIADLEWYKPFIGGLGVYGPKSHRGPFIHVDTRGIRARWYKP